MNTTTRATLRATFGFAVDRATAAGLDATGWQLTMGNKAYGYRYQIVGRSDGYLSPPLRIDLGATANQAHVTLTAVAAAWHAVATALAARAER